MEKTLRDEIALAYLSAKWNNTNGLPSCELINIKDTEYYSEAKIAYMVADAVLKQRETKQIGGAND